MKTKVEKIKININTPNIIVRLHYSDIESSRILSSINLKHNKFKRTLSNGILELTEIPYKLFSFNKDVIENQDASAYIDIFVSHAFKELELYSNTQLETEMILNAKKISLYEKSSLKCNYILNNLYPITIETSSNTTLNSQFIYANSNVNKFSASMNSHIVINKGLIDSSEIESFQNSMIDFKDVVFKNLSINIKDTSIQEFGLSGTGIVKEYSKESSLSYFGDGKLFFKDLKIVNPYQMKIDKGLTEFFNELNVEKYIANFLNLYKERNSLEFDLERKYFKTILLENKILEDELEIEKFILLLSRDYPTEYISEEYLFENNFNRKALIKHLLFFKNKSSFLNDLDNKSLDNYNLLSFIYLKNNLKNDNINF